jgi:L-ribulose-5-phosphate 4-epimerase
VTLDELRERVLVANLALPAHGLVKLTSGNVSAIDRDRAVVAIKPSGVPYDALTADALAVVDLEGNVIAGERRPSSDTPTHLVLYREFTEIGAIVHTHSTWATAWAQAQREIPLLGTTHADLCAHPIPITRPLTRQEIDGDYERATGEALVEAVSEHGPAELPCALVRGHAPFCWGADPADAVAAAVSLEEVARVALLTTILNPEVAPLAQTLRDKHHQRKHGPRAYYGQR